MEMQRMLFNVQMSTQADSTANITIYSEIKSDNETWDGEKIKSETSANTFREKLFALGDVKNINLYINSQGGSCFEGNAIYSMLKRHTAYKTAYIDGYACSQASVLPMACNKIIMSDNAVMMIHNPWMRACGNAFELRKQADALDRMASAFRQAYMVRFNQSEEKLTELLEAETWLTAKDCIAYNLADEIAGKIKENKEEEPQQKTKQEFLAQNSFDIEKFKSYMH